MKRLLLPLLAALALPTAVNAESVWLIIRVGYQGIGHFEKIEMKDMDQCELMGAKWKSSNIFHQRTEDPSIGTFTCLRGK